MRNRQIEKIVWLMVMEETHYCCAYCGASRGRIGAGIEGHHIGGRDNITRFNPLAQIGLCDDHHKWDLEFSAHTTPKKFLKWLKKNYPAKYRFYIRTHYKILQDRDVDFDEIRRRLKVA